MKIDQSNLKKKPREIPADSNLLIEKIKTCDRNELNELLIKSITVWSIEKCRLYHWIDVLDRFDSILEEACLKTEKWILNCDKPENVQLKTLVIHILRFTELLIEHSYTRSLYNSIEYLIILLQSSHPDIILGVLSLTYTFSKRSNYLNNKPSEIKEKLFNRLGSLADKWAGLDLKQCCTLRNPSNFPENLINIHFTYKISSESTNENEIHIENVHLSDRNADEIMEEIVNEHELSEDDQMKLFVQLSIAHSFSSFEQRLLWIRIRLQSLAILIYSSAMIQVKSLLYKNFIKELVQVLRYSNPSLTDVKASIFKTLAAIIHLERKEQFEEVPSPLQKVIKLTQADAFDGFLPRLVRQTVDKLIDGSGKDDFSTAILSFLYHLASYETGGDALNNSQIIESLIKIIDHHDQSREFIQLVCRAVRVIHLLTMRDPSLIQKGHLLQSVIDRLQNQVKQCQNEQNKPLSETCYHQSIRLFKAIIDFLKNNFKETSVDINIRHMIRDSTANSLKDIINNVDYYGLVLSQFATDLLTLYTEQ